MEFLTDQHYDEDDGLQSVVAESSAQSDFTQDVIGAHRRRQWFGGMVRAASLIGAAAVTILV